MFDRPRQDSAAAQVFADFLERRRRQQRTGFLRRADAVVIETDRATGFQTVAWYVAASACLIGVGVMLHG
jgi:hypothetical protein